MNIKIVIILLSLYNFCICFKPVLIGNNNNLKKKYIDRNIYAKYLKDIKKTKKFISESTTTLIKYKNESKFDIYYNNTDIKFKKIIINDKIYIDIENIKEIYINSENGKLKIELDKKNTNIMKLYDNIKDIDTLINIINFLTYIINK
tara:strand:+ start:667 stop:1107 length:441 start_codon:yes stop_codon:yes gene_type:complete